jgi:hypothetical protein
MLIYSMLIYSYKNSNGKTQLEKQFACIWNFDFGHEGRRFFAILAPSHVTNQSALGANINLM